MAAAEMASATLITAGTPKSRESRGTSGTARTVPRPAAVAVRPETVLEMPQRSISSESSGFATESATPTSVTSRIAATMTRDWPFCWAWVVMVRIHPLPSSVVG